MMPIISRRRLLSMAANVLAFSTVAGTGFPVTGIAQTAAEPNLRRVLARLARDLFPHDGLPDRVYDEIAGMIIAAESGSTGDLEMLEDGLAMLDGHTPAGNWYTSDAAARLAALEAIASTDFFRSMLARVNGALYLRQETWDLVGYGGSALEKGGYINRGFNDIDWL